MNAADIQTTELECVEVYVPKKLDNVSALYAFLKSKLNMPEPGINGFSLYEVDGVFRGDRLYEERTVVVRILFQRRAEHDDIALQEQIMALGKEIAVAVSYSEEELWICHFSLNGVVFRPGRRVGL